MGASGDAKEAKEHRRRRTKGANNKRFVLPFLGSWLRAIIQSGKA